MSRPRILLTGAGSIAQRHASNLQQLLPGCEIWAVGVSAGAREWGARAGVHIVDSIDIPKLPAPQLAVVCSESSRHSAELAALMPVIEALYVEKPLVTDASSLAAVSRMISEGWSKPSVVGCNLRYLGAIRRLKEACDSGAAGRVVQASLRVGQWLPDWRPGRDWRRSYSADRSRGGGVLFDLVHELDSACFLFGPILHGQTAAGSLSRLELDADDSAAMTLLMESGLPVQVSMDYVSRRPVREYLVIGDEATLRLDLIQRRLTRDSSAGTETLPCDESDWDMSNTYRTAMADLIAGWRHGRTTAYSLSDALHTTSWMLQLEANAWRRHGDSFA